MPETGDAGFEVLVASLLSALTGDRFYVSRAGDQPADAVAFAADVAIQTKRYNRTAVDETKFEGEFGKACRRFPSLDCYVFAVTRSTAQLHLLALELQDKEGVDILLLGFDKINSELPALCVTFWAQVKHFPGLNTLGADFAVWAASQAARCDVVATIRRVREDLTSSLPVVAMVRRKLQRYLDIRFAINPSATRAVRFNIDLPRTIRRQRPDQLLHEWWDRKQANTALLVGDEGMGKSVVAARFSHTVSKSGSALVLWLDSADWAGLNSIEEVVAAGLKMAGFADEKLRRRLVRKALRRWSANLLIVLDGVTEKNARESAHRLLADVDARETLCPRLLFTGRQVQWHAHERALWQTASIIPIQPFTDSELAEALGTLSPPIPVEELPDGLIEVAKIPRYFKRAVELRAQFKSLRHVSHEMVLWVDLLEKVQSGEPQVTDNIGWKSPADLKRGMTALASAALNLPTGPTAGSQAYAILQKSFGHDFERIRLDLAEQRIVLDPVGEHPIINRSHVILGFALRVGSIAAEHGNDSVDNLADRFRRELEPLLSQDYLTEALFVALQLSALPDRAPHTLASRARAAFLFTWACSQNSIVDDERLSFWATRDPAAYLDFVEELFVEPVSDAWCHRVIKPLQDMWSVATAPAVVACRLRTWLKLVWRRDLQRQSQLNEGKYLLPVARSQDQLVLSNVAIAILAENPIPDFLDDLAVATATDVLSREQHQFKDAASGEKKTRDFPCKHMDNNLGPVLRWRFTESVKPVLQALAASSGDDTVLAKGVKDLITSFDLFGWTWSAPNAQSLRNRESLFRKDTGGGINRIIDIPELAAREDLPDIGADDQAIIAEKIESAFSSPELRNDPWSTTRSMDVDYYLAWFAKHRPQRLADIGAKFRLESLDKTKPWVALDLANDLPYNPKIVSPRQLLDAAKALLRRIPEDAPERYEGSLLETHVLALTCLDPPELREWLIFAAGHKRARAHIHFWQVHLLCRYLPEEVALFAREEARRCCEEQPDESDLSTSHFDYWTAIGGAAGPQDEEFHRWVDGEMRRRTLTSHRLFYWRLLWFRTAPKEMLLEYVTNGTILDVLTKEGLRALLFADRTIADWSYLSIGIESLLQLISLDLVGTLLCLGNRDTELDRWGDLIFSQALKHVGRPVVEREFWGTTILERDSAGRIASSTCDWELSQTPQAERVRPEPTSLIDYAAQFAIEEKNREANAAIKTWRGDVAAIRDLDEGALSQFSAFYALETWRDGHPSEFKQYAIRLLTAAIERPGKAYHIGGFVSAVIDALVPLEPELAYQIYSRLENSAFRVTLVNEYGQSTFVAALWRSAKVGDDKAVAICRRICETSTTDEETAKLAIVAIAEGAEENLLSVCADLLESQLAKDRALAVSLLAWIPTEAAVNRLHDLVKSDPSGWIRTHSTWALDVAQHERAIRAYYRDTLKFNDHNAVRARLQVLLPALTLSARSWHRQIEDRELTKDNSPPEKEAALALFWYNFRSRSKNPPKNVFKRVLREYLRGECLRDLRAPKPRLLDSEAELHGRNRNP